VHRPAIYPGLADQTVFITGGGSGIGAAITAGFAGQKAKVAFVDVAERQSRATCSQMESETGRRPLFIPCISATSRRCGYYLVGGVKNLGTYSQSWSVKAPRTEGGGAWICSGQKKLLNRGNRATDQC
jgi:hypothetical protein